MAEVTEHVSHAHFKTCLFHNSSNFLMFLLRFPIGLDGPLSLFCVVGPGSGREWPVFLS